MTRSPRLVPLRALSLGLGILPPGCGQSAVARLVTRRRWGRQFVTRQRLRTGAAVELDLGDPPQSVAFVTRRYEPDMITAISRLLPDRGILFDVGANIGLITFSVAAIRPEVSIHAFEPDPSNAERWRRNHKLNPDARAALEPTALGASAGAVSMVRGHEAGWTHVGPAVGSATPMAEMTTLDSYVDERGISTVDVLKLDVEGYELFALRGGQELLDRHRIGAIVCELNDPLLARYGVKRADVISFLAGYGYSPNLIPHTGARRFRRAETLETSGDLVFMRR